MKFIQKVWQKITRFCWEHSSQERKEAIRYLFLRNNAKGWTSKGKVYRTGLALVENRWTGKKQFTTQASLCDIGIL